MTHFELKPNQYSNRNARMVGVMLGFFGLAMIAPGIGHGSTLDVRHGGPFTGLFGFPSPAESLALDPEVGWRLDFTLQGASHSVSEVSGNEELLLDGESWRSALRLRIRAGARLELGIEVPWIRHTGGSLDGLIDDWHSVLGLPDGIRDQRPEDAITFSYRSSSDAQLEFDRNVSGIGDIRLSAGYLMARHSDGSLALRFGVELPTGDADKLTGNGGSDVSMAIAWERESRAGGRRWASHVVAGAVRFGDSDLSAIQTREWGAWVQAGLGWYLTPSVEILGSIQSATSPIDSGLRAYDGGSLMLSLGAGFDIGKHYRLDLGFSEDINVESAPDIMFLLRLSRR